MAAFSPDRCRKDRTIFMRKDLKEIFRHGRLLNPCESRLQFLQLFQVFGEMAANIAFSLVPNVSRSNQLRAGLLKSF